MKLQKGACGGRFKFKDKSRVPYNVVLLFFIRARRMCGLVRLDFLWVKSEESNAVEK